MEINTIRICIIIEKSKKRITEKNQTSVNYYIIQCMASILLLRVIMTKEINQETKIIIGIIILIVKIGVWPFHMWYVKVLSEIRIKRKAFTIIVTWQKVIPTIILIRVINLKNYEIIIVVVINIIVTITIIKKKTSIKSIIILSSGFNNSIIICSSTRTSILVMFIIVYSTSVILALKILIKTKKKRINPKKQTLEEAIITANLGGLPPFMLFFGKVIVIKRLVRINLIELTFLIIVLICGFMYHYYWSVSSMLIDRISKTQLHMKRNTKKTTTLLITASSIGVILIILLGLTKRVYLDRVKINKPIGESVKHISVWD